MAGVAISDGKMNASHFAQIVFELMCDFQKRSLPQGGRAFIDLARFQMGAYCCR